MNVNVDTSTQYLGMTIKSPIIASSSDFTNDIEKMILLEQAGVGAVVLKSIFEEQILAESDSYRINNMFNSYEYAEQYIAFYTKQNHLQKYLQLIRDAKAKLTVPVVASIHCSTDESWMEFTREIEMAGADALELNIFILPSEINQSEKEIRSRYFSIVDKVKACTKLPLSVKLHYYFTDLAAFASELSNKVEGLVLFNRFFSPDIDLDKMEIISAGSLSRPEDNFQVLRWIGLLNKKVNSSLLASGGIHDAKTLIKNILSGADACQIASILYLDGPSAVSKINLELCDFMKKKGFNSIAEMKGMMARNEDKNKLYERAQFMKYFSDFKK